MNHKSLKPTAFGQQLKEGNTWKTWAICQPVTINHRYSLVSSLILEELPVVIQIRVRNMAPTCRFINAPSLVSPDLSFNEISILVFCCAFRGDWILWCQESQSLWSTGVSTLQELTSLTSWLFTNFRTQFPQEKFLSYGRIFTLHYYFLLMCILFSSFRNCLCQIFGFLLVFSLFYLQLIRKPSIFKFSCFLELNC